MAILKILKNVSGSKLQILNRDINNNESYNVDPNMWLKLANNDIIISHINTGNIIVNNGTSDLSIEEGLLWIKRFQSDPESINIPFDNSNNGFNSTNVQDAIEEARTPVIARVPIMFGFDGSAGVGRWLELTSNVTSKLSGFVVPRTAKLKEISISCQANVTMTATIYKNGEAITTINLILDRKAVVTGLNINLTSLDELSAKVTIGACSRPLLCLFLELF